MSAPQPFDTAFLKRIERLAVVARKTFRGAGQGERRTRKQGASVEFRDHRLYSAGDDLRHLDWNLLARHDRLYLKRFHDEQDVRVHLVIDASASMSVGEPSKFDVARQLAAALGWLALTGRDSVVLHALGGEGLAPPPPLQGRTGARRLLAFLEGLRPAGAVDLAEALTELGRRLGRPGIVMVLSDLLSEGAAQGIERLAAGRHQVHVLHLLAPEEREPQIEGDVRLVDVETGRDVIVSMSPRLRRIYADTLAGLRSELAGAAKRCGASLSSAGTDEPIEDLIFQRLAAQGILASRAG